MPHLPEIISNKLAKLKKRIRFYTLSEGIAKLLILTLIIVVITFLFDYATPLPFAMRLFINIIALALIAAGIQKWLVIPLVKRLNKDDLAIMVEDKFRGSESDFKDSLISTVQFASDIQSEYEFNSQLLVKNVIEKTSEKCKDVIFLKAANPKKALRLLTWATLAIVIIGVYAGVAPQNAEIWFQRVILLSNIQWPKVNRLVLANKPDELVVASGDMLELRFRSVGKRKPSHVSLNAWFVDSSGKPIGGVARNESFDMESHGEELFIKNF